MESNQLHDIYQLLSLMRENKVRSTLEQLQEQAKDAESKSLIPYGRKVYSQNEEDGIIQEIFRRIGTTNQRFVEFGVGHGVDNNTLALLFGGWQGLWIEGSTDACNDIKNQLPSVLGSRQLSLINSFITKDNINGLIAAAMPPGSIDLLSVDIDGNDFAVFDAISHVQARVIVIEYNAKFAPPIEYCMAYKEDHEWQGDDCFGASLQYLENGFATKGYALVSCNLTGTNAFFVQQSLLGDLFQSPFTAQHHYQPARYELSGFPNGHRPSLRTLEGSIRSPMGAQLNQ